MSVNRKIVVELLPSTRTVAPALRGVSKNVGRLSRDVQAHSRRMREAFTGAFRQIRNAATVMTVGLTATMGAGVKVAGDFEERMRNVNSIARQSERAFAATSREVLSLNREIGTAQKPRVMAAALYDINSAGFQATDGIEVLKEAATGADAGLTTAAVAADGLTTNLKAFNLPASKSAKTMDVMFKTVELGKLTFEDLANNIGKVATFSSSAGVSLEELHAGMAVLTGNGIKAEEAAVALRGAIKGILNPAAEAKTLYDELGVSYGQTALKQKGLIAILQQMEKATGGDTAQMAKMLGDVRGLNAALALLSNDGGKKAVSFLDAMKNADGAKLSALEQQSKGLNFQMRRLAGSMESFAIQVQGAIIPVVKDLVSLVERWTNSLANLSTEQKEMIGKVLAAAAGVSALVAAISGAVVYLGAMKAALATLGVSSIGVAVSKLSGLLARLLARVNPITAAVATLATAWAADFAGIRTATSRTISEIGEIFGDGFDLLIEVGREYAAYMSFVFAQVKAAASFLLSFFDDEFRTGIVAVLESVKVIMRAMVEAAKVGFIALRTSAKAYAAVMSGDLSEAHKIAKDGFEEFVGASQEGWRRVEQSYSSAEDSVEEAYHGMYRSSLSTTSDTVDAFAGLHVAIVDHVNQATNSSTKSFVEMRRESLKQIGLIQEGIESLTDGVRGFSSALSSAPGRLGSLVGQGAQYLDRHQKIDRIKKHDPGLIPHGVNIDDLQDEVLNYTVNMIEMLERDGLRLFPTSGADGVHSPNSHHHTGNALDARIGKNSPHDMQGEQEREAARKYGYAAGFHSVLYERDHIHLSAKPESPNHPDYLRPGGPTDAEKKEKLKAQKEAEREAKRLEREAARAHKQHLEDKKSAQESHWDFMLSGQSDYEQQRLAQLARFHEQTEAYGNGFLTPDQYAEAVVANQAALAQIKTDIINATQEISDAEDNIALSSVDAAISMAEKNRQILENDDSFRKEFHDARLQRIFSEFEHQVAMDQLSYEQKVLWYEQMLELETLNTEQRRQLQQGLHNLRKQHEQERLQHSQQVSQQLTGTFQQFLVQTLSGQKKFGDTFKNLWKSIMNTIIAEISKAIIKALALQKILGGLFGIFHGGGVVSTGATKAVSASSSATVDALNWTLPPNYHSGGLVAKLPKFHTGGLVGNGGLFSGGLRPDEIVAKLQTGEAVLPRRLVNELRSPNGRTAMSSTAVSIGEFHSYGEQDVDQLSRALAWQSYAHSKGG